MSEAKPRLLLAEDHEDLLAEVASLLGTDFAIVGTACDGVRLLESASELKPDVVVTDYKMPGLDGIEAGRKLLSEGYCKAVVLLTLYGDPILIRQAFEAGIRGYVLKLDAVDNLVEAVHAALEGRTYFTVPPT